MSRRASLAGLGVAASMPWLVGCASRPLEAMSPAAHDDPAVQGWEHFRLPGKRPTEYRRVQKQGVPAWHAKADRSASMWRKPVHRAPDLLSEVEFSWWVPSLIDSADLAQADAADSPARVVFAFDGDHGRLSARDRAMFELASVLTGESPPFATLMYVWEPRATHEQVLRSARTDRVRKIVVESGPKHLGQWRRYRRNLKHDFTRAYGEAPGALIGIGIMTDADNTGRRAEAWYGDIRLL